MGNLRGRNAAEYPEQTDEKAVSATIEAVFAATEQSGYAALDSLYASEDLSTIAVGLAGTAKKPQRWIEIPLGRMWYSQGAFGRLDCGIRDGIRARRSRGGGCRTSRPLRLMRQW
jgi:hypothetical protein